MIFGFLWIDFILLVLKLLELFCKNGGEEICYKCLKIFVVFGFNSVIVLIYK